MQQVMPSPAQSAGLSHAKPVPPAASHASAVWQVWLASRPVVTQQT